MIFTAPLRVKSTEVNAGLPDSLETLGRDPYGEGWMLKLRITDDAGLEKLMDYSAVSDPMCRGRLIPEEFHGMAYFFNTNDDIQEMLRAIGAESIESLFEPIPTELRLDRPLAIPPAMSEMELTQHMSALAGHNEHAQSSVCFLGAGSYDHFIPAVVDAIASRGEFFTSYTPYQPEVSQGNLQAMFEYQTLVCQLTGMDVSNASLYDGGSAVTEAALMCLSVTKRFGNVVVADSVHPEYRQILRTYLQNLETELRTVTSADGTVSAADVQSHIDDQTACVIIQHPNFWGRLEPLDEISNAAHARGCRVVVACDPISLGILRARATSARTSWSPKDNAWVHRWPSAARTWESWPAARSSSAASPVDSLARRIDRRGRRCWVLTLQTREQHIRRDKATSNICTNQGLFALRAAVYLSLLGPQGLRETAHACLQKAQYAARRIAATERFEWAFPGPMFKEFVVRDRADDVEGVLEHARKAGILAGVPLGRWYDHLHDCFLVAVTEQRTKAEIDRWAECLASVSVADHALA